MLGWSTQTSYQNHQKLITDSISQHQVRKLNHKSLGQHTGKVGPGGLNRCVQTFIGMPPLMGGLNNFTRGLNNLMRGLDNLEGKFHMLISKFVYTMMC